MKKFIVEKQVGNVSCIKYNLLVQDIDDMQVLEDWEDRLESFGEDYTIVYKEKKGKILYSIFCNTRTMHSAFNVHKSVKAEDEGMI